jgi:hypothetical protein
LNKKFCNTKCSNNSPLTKDKFRNSYNLLSDIQKENRNKKRTKTVNDKYGGYTLESEELNRKMRSTMITLYGVEHAFQSKEIKKKTIDSWVGKYGVSNPSKLDSIKKKIESILMLKYSVNNAGLIDVEKRIKAAIKTKKEKGLIIPDEFISDYKKYQKECRRKTEKNYKNYKNLVNPSNFERVTNGKSGHQLDHKYSVFNGFIDGINTDTISHPCNLQMIKWEENRKKGIKNSIEIEVLTEQIKIFKND